MPQELRAEKTLEKFKDIHGLAKSYIETEKLISRKGIILPGDNATPDEIGAFHKAIGRPDTPDGYELRPPVDLPQGMTFDESKAKAFAETAHKLGIPKAAVQGIYEWFNAAQNAEWESQGAQAAAFIAKSQEELKKEWGGNYDMNLQQADAAIDKVFGPEFKQMLIDTGLNNHPAVVKGMFNASQAIGEHGFARQGASDTGDPAVTYDKIVSMKMDKRYPTDPAYVREVNAMVEQYTRQGGRRS